MLAGIWSICAVLQAAVRRQAAANAAGRLGDRTLGHWNFKSTPCPARHVHFISATTQSAIELL
jgi:hypothetical protein